MQRNIFGFMEMLLGITSLCIGSTLGILAGLGQTTSTGTCSAIAGATGLQVGTAMIVLYSFFLLLQILILRRDFHPTRILQLVPVWLQGMILNYFRYSFPPFQSLSPRTYEEKFALFLAGMVLISLGFIMVKCANFLNYPPESFCALLSQRLGIRFGTCKIALDFVYVLTTLAICWTFSLDFDIVGEGTVIFAICNGLLINLFQPRVERLFWHIRAAPQI